MKTQKLIITIATLMMCIISKAQVSPVGSGVNAAVTGFNTDSTNLLIACDTAGQTASVQEWNGSSYTTFPGLFSAGNGTPAGTVAYFAGQKYAVCYSGYGDPTIIFGWNGTSWVNYAQNSSPNMYFSCLFGDASYLYAAGYCGGISPGLNLNVNLPSPSSVSNTYGKVKFSGTAWSKTGTTQIIGRVTNIRKFGTTYYYTGNMSYGTTTTNVGVTKYGPTNFSAVAPYGNNDLVTASSEYVSDVAMYNGNLYACGNFAAPYNTAYVAMWNGSAWVAVGSAPVAQGTSLAVFDGKLYVGLNSGSGPNLVSYDGTNWTTITGLTGGGVTSLEVIGNTLYIGGAITVPNHIAEIVHSVITGEQTHEINRAFHSYIYDGVFNFASDKVMSIALYDIRGSLIYTGKTDRIELPVEAGVYVLQTEAGSMKMVSVK
jgi:hypothetical protein